MTPAFKAPNYETIISIDDSLFNSKPKTFPF